MVLEIYSVNIIDENAPLKPELSGWMELYTWHDRIVRQISIWMGDLMHTYGGQIRYTGTGKRGTGYLVCSVCGHKKKYALVRPTT